MLRNGMGLTVVVLLLVGRAAFADGMLIPGPPTAVIPDEPYFSVKYHHVKSEIRDQVCTTYVDQVFVNEGSREMEATYLFPMPAGAVIRKFSLYADGQEVAARLLEKEEAQRIYEDIVRRRRDPALLTYAGNNAYQARIFPIPPGGERRIELRYSEVLHYDNGLVSYLYPLSPEKFSSRPIPSVAVVADIEAREPIGSVYSPTHEIEVNRLSDRHVRVSYEESNTLPNRDLVLYYGVAQDPVGLSVITFKEANRDGFYLLLAAPTIEQERGDVVPKNICFVLDTSGSMSGEKIEQAKDALKFCVNSLNPEDRFDIVAFSDEVRSFADELVPASKERTRKAREFIEEFEAGGGTNIDGALQAALRLRRPDQPNYICFLTDGQPTAGETEPDRIMENVATQVSRQPGRQMARSRAHSPGPSWRGSAHLPGGLPPRKEAPIRLFVFGVGYDVNTNFLDKLAQGNGGLTTYVRPNEDIEVNVSSFYSKIAQPILTEIGLDYGRVETFDEFPRELPDLFHGSQLEVFGRYKKRTAGSATVRLTGETRRGSRTFQLACDFPEVTVGTDYVAALWAARKIGYLLDQIRLHGESRELVDEIVRLSLEYGILTEYTAFLAEEGRAIPLAEAAERAAGEMRAGFAAPSGPGATSRAQNAQVMQMQKQVGQTNQYLDEAGNWQRVANIQNVGQRAFVQRQGRWEDTRYQPQQRIALRVQAYSEAHFQLSRQFPELNSQLAVGDNVLVILNGQAVEIGPEGKASLTERELRALAVGEPL